MKNHLAIIIPAVLLMIGIGIAYQMIKSNQKLPIYSPGMINPDLVDESKQNITRNHRIADFSLIDQNGNTFTEQNLKGKFYVTDFFFTSCPDICKDMSANLVRVQKAHKNMDDFLIVSHSVTPEFDNPKVLTDYGKRYGADFDKWIFLTGDKKEIYNLARKSYFAATTEGDGGVDDFIHTENFVLVDKEKRIRGYYDGTDPKSVDQLIDDIEILSRAYDK